MIIDSLSFCPLLRSYTQVHHSSIYSTLQPSIHAIDNTLTLWGKGKSSCHAIMWPEDIKSIAYYQLSHVKGFSDFVWVSLNEMGIQIILL